MSDTRRRRRHFSPERRTEVVTELARSGLTVSEFATEVGIHSTTLYRWRRVAEEIGEGTAQVNGRASGGAEHPFVRVHVVDEVDRSRGTGPQATSLTLRHVSGWSVEVPKNFDSGALARVLAAVTPGC